MTVSSILNATKSCSPLILTSSKRCTMQRNVIFLLAAAFCFSAVSCANILDLLFWDSVGANGHVEKRDENVETSGEKSCDCAGPSCMCCVDFNITYIDLGGPGCVNMKYQSQEEGLLVNVSYGDSLLHSEQVKGPNPEPTCMALLANLAEVCARFTSLEPHDDGLKGCLQLEPKLLGDIQTQFNIGCFTMGPDGMKLDEAATAIARPIDNDADRTNGTQLNEEELIAAVSESAQQGLAFFGNLLGLTFGTQEANKTETTETTTTEGPKARSWAPSGTSAIRTK